MWIFWELAVLSFSAHSSTVFFSVKNSDLSIPERSYPMVDAASECGSEVPHNSSKPWTPLPTPPKWPTGPQWLRVRMTGSSDFPIFVWGRNEQNFQAGFFQSRWSKSHKLVSLQGITLPSTHNLSKLTTFSNSKEKELLPKNEFVFAESYYVTYCLGTCNKLRKTTVTGVHPDWADRPSLLLTAASVAVDKSIHSQFGSLKFTRQLIVWLEILNIYILWINHFLLFRQKTAAWQSVIFYIAFLLILETKQKFE